MPQNQSSDNPRSRVWLFHPEGGTTASADHSLSDKFNLPEMLLLRRHVSKTTATVNKYV